MQSSLPSRPDIHIVPWQSLINRPVIVRLGEEGGRIETKTFLRGQYKSQGCIKMGWREGWRAAIDPQSQSSGFHVSRCQVSAIGAAWKMSLCSAIMEQHRFRSVCASSGRTERHWFTSAMTEAVKSASVHTFAYYGEALLLMMYGTKSHWALNFKSLLLWEKLSELYTKLSLAGFVLCEGAETPPGDKVYCSDLTRICYWTK